MKTITEVIAPISLLRGSHKDTAKTGQGCFMNAIAYLNGEPQITDESECVCYVVRPIAIWLNDFLNDDERARLIPYIERAMGSRTDDKVEVMRRVWLAVDFANVSRDLAAKYAESAEYAEYAAKSAAKYAKYAEYAEYAAKSAAKYAKYAAKSAEYAAKSAAESAEYAAKSAAKYAKYAEYAAEYAEYAAKSAAEYAAEYAEYAAKSAAKSAAESAEYAEYAAEYAAFRMAIIEAAFVFLDSALPKTITQPEVIYERAERLIALGV